MTQSLKTRVSLTLTAAMAVLLILGGILWVRQTRQSIHEEIEAATHVAEQWLGAAAADVRGGGQHWTPDTLLAQVRITGRIRANALEIFAADGQSIYASPPPVYKAGRTAPAWFSRLVEPEFPPHRIDAGAYSMVLKPDPSRATLDAWDDLATALGWALTLLVLLFLASRLALARALAPLAQVMEALTSTGRGRFDTRLPVYSVTELGHLARAFNGMADRLEEAMNENVRLECDREFSLRIHHRLEEERRAIAREIHDEMSQGITAVRALAGAIVQRSSEQPTIGNAARSIVDVTTELQEGVNGILGHLRPVTGPLAEMLTRYVESWRPRHPEIELKVELAADLPPVAEDTALAALRIVQEGLTNVARHSAANRAQLQVGLDSQQEVLTLSLTDNGRGTAAPSPAAGSGLGLTGIRERVAALGGTMALENQSEGGASLQVCLPLAPLTAKEMPWNP
ncbi:MAG TPA: HAMP domain-containing protein [Rhodocyclaceae bacterium]